MSDKRRQERIASVIFDSISDGVFTTDRECRITSFNRAAERISGFSREEAVGQNPRILKSGKQDGAFYYSLWKKIFTSKRIYSFFYSLISPYFFFFFFKQKTAYEMLM